MQKKAEQVSNMINDRISTGEHNARHWVNFLARKNRENAFFMKDRGRTMGYIQYYLLDITFGFMISCVILCYLFWFVFIRKIKT